MLLCDVIFVDFFISLPPIRRHRFRWWWWGVRACVTERTEEDCTERCHSDVFCEESVLWYFLCTHSHSPKKSFKEFINKSFSVILISSSPTRTERSILYLYCPYSTARDENYSILHGVPFFTASKSSCCSETIFGATLLFDWQLRKSAWKQRKITPETPEREEPRRQRGVD